MWMKDTRATWISVTVFHKHNYTTNPNIIPKDQVIEASGKLEDDIKGHMPPHLSETTLEQLGRIGNILKQGRTRMV